MKTQSEIAIDKEKYMTQVATGSFPKVVHLGRKCEQIIIEEDGYEGSSREK